MAAIPILMKDVNNGYAVIWEALGNADTGGVFTPFRTVKAMSFQATGTFGTGATVTVLGSNDGTNFVALPTTVTFTAAGLKSVALEDLGINYYRVNTSGGVGTTDIDVTAFVRTSG